MLKYLIIQIDDTSVSFCHYDNSRLHSCLIDLEILKKAIIWSMKENLSIQILYPKFEIPADYKNVISSVDHTDIVSSECQDKKLRLNADVLVFDSWKSTIEYPFSQSDSIVIRTTFKDLFDNEISIKSTLTHVSRINIVITDIENLNESSEKKYYEFLIRINNLIVHEYKKGHQVQINILTDRFMLKSMNNCSAGDESITLAPNGSFYICPGFYMDNSQDVGNLDNGLNIKNRQLYKLEYAPICRICDAWQCKRCVWLNKKMTFEINTPGREQCVLSHIERNVTKELLSDIKNIGERFPFKEIPTISYLDPFEKLVKQQ